MEEANNASMDSFLIWCLYFMSSSSCFLIFVFYWVEVFYRRAQQLKLWLNTSSDSSILRFFLCQSLFQCVASGVEKFMKERSDDAILVFSLLCPPPSCHNTELEFQKGKMLERAGSCHQQKTFFRITYASLYVAFYRRKCISNND